MTSDITNSLWGPGASPFFFLGTVVHKVALFLGRDSTVCHDLSGFVSWTTLSLCHELNMLEDEFVCDDTSGFFLGGFVSWTRYYRMP